MLLNIQNDFLSQLLFRQYDKSYFSQRQTR